jgi:ABC-2 type transport system permease protein
MNIALVIRTLKDHWKSTFMWSLGIVSITSIQLYIYPSVVESSTAMQSYIDAFPDALKTIFRLEDYFSGEGFLGTELYSMMVPLILISLSSSRGSSAIAGEEESGSADILFVLPISRSRIVISKLFALVIESLVVITSLVVAIAIGSKLVDLDISMRKVLVASLAAMLLGLIFGSFALIAGALTGKKAIATGIAVAAAIAALLFYSLAPIVDTFEILTPFNPMDWAINGNPLSDGVSAVNFGKLLGLFLLSSVTALLVFRNRDIKA